MRRLFETLLAAALRVPFLGAPFERLLEWLFHQSARAVKRARRDYIRPRQWSNAELRRLAPMFKGATINVSGWLDEDKLGGFYRQYFPNASSYIVSNYSGARGKAEGDASIFLDLEGDLPVEQAGKYQIVFNHTTLEHVYDIRRAVANLCALSNDAVILVTPFLQNVHFVEGSFGDYWRPTPMCLTRMLAENGFTTIYQSCNDNPWYTVYLFTIAARNPANYRDRLPPLVEPLAGVRHFVF